MNMFQSVCDPSNLVAAYEKVKKNRGCPGVDKQSITAFGEHLDHHTRELSRLLTNNTYQPLPVARVLIPKANGKLRPLGIPAVRDRIVQQAVLDQIQPTLEEAFSDVSFGFRPQRSAHGALNAIRIYLDQGYEYVVDADIRDFFGTLNHQILMAKVRDMIPDRAITRLIYQFLTAGVMSEGKLIAQTTGTPQGGVISPILANLYLTEFDDKITKGDWKLVRYADDWVLLCKTPQQAHHALQTASGTLKKLKLELAPEKTKIANMSRGDAFTFLGYTFQKVWGRHYSFPSDKAIKAYQDKIKGHTKRQQPRNITKVIERLNPLICGWGNYFKHGHGKKRFQRLDEWTRMRLRSFLKKGHALSITTHTKYPNAFFKTLGLATLIDLYSPHHG